MPADQSVRPDRKIDELKLMVDALHAKLDRVVDLIKNTAKPAPLSDTPVSQTEVKVSLKKEEPLAEKSSVVIKKKVSKKAPAKKK